MMNDNPSAQLSLYRVSIMLSMTVSFFLFIYLLFIYLFVCLFIIIFIIKNMNYLKYMLY